MMQAALDALDQRARRRGRGGDRRRRRGVQPCCCTRPAAGSRRACCRARRPAATTATTARRVASAPDGRPVLACASQTRFGEQTGLALWRAPGSRAWDDDDAMLVSSSPPHRPHGARPRRDPARDGAPGAHRSADRPAQPARLHGRDGPPHRPAGARGAAGHADVRRPRQLQGAERHAAATTPATRRCASPPRCCAARVRPTDLVARLGGDEFAVWLDGADEFDRRRARRGPAHGGAAGTAPI